MIKNTSKFKNKMKYMNKRVDLEVRIVNFLEQNLFLFSYLGSGFIYYILTI